MKYPKEFEAQWSKAMAEMELEEVEENRSRLGHQKAAWAVDRARCELHRLGFVVDPPSAVTANGPDLVFYPGGTKVQYCEVKLAMWNVGSKAGAWRVNRVTRKRDQYIAIVFPSGHVQLEAMRDHLKLCCASGDRYLTTLGRLFE